MKKRMMHGFEHLKGAVWGQKVLQGSEAKMREGGMKENNYLPDERSFNSPSDLMIYKKKSKLKKMS